MICYLNITRRMGSNSINILMEKRWKGRMICDSKLHIPTQRLLEMRLAQIQRSSMPKI